MTALPSLLDNTIVYSFCDLHGLANFLPTQNLTESFKNFSHNTGTTLVLETVLEPHNPDATIQYHQANPTLHCGNTIRHTAEDAREAIGHFVVPSFPLNWNNRSLDEFIYSRHISQRSRYLEEVLDDDDDEAAPPLTTLSSESNATNPTAKSTSLLKATKKAKKAAKKASLHQQKLAKILGSNSVKTTTKSNLNTSKTVKVTKETDDNAPRQENDSTGSPKSNDTSDTLKLTSAVPRKIINILKVGNMTRDLKKTSENISTYKTEENSKCRKRTYTNCEADCDSLPPVKKGCKIVLKIMKK
ncbi:hypothetical protein DL98DRAFT_536833 [Cadophora sp. DSE1049]|nr:hypothetical protein DL98DRAFT_536833 [Cadophora sp. DSE1049]